MFLLLARVAGQAGSALAMPREPIPTRGAIFVIDGRAKEETGSWVVRLRTLPLHLPYA